MSDPPPTSSIGSTAPTTAASTQATAPASQPAPLATDSAPQQAAAQPSPAQAEKEKTLAEFLLAMDDHQPLIPDAVTEYYLARTGFECDDVRIKRLLALVAQKFISDVVTDAFQYSRVHQLNNKERKYTQKDRRSLLTMDDLSQALQEYGVNVRKPEYYS